MDKNEFKVQLGQNKFRDEREVRAFAKLVEVKGVSVKSLDLIINSDTGLEAQQKLLKVPLLSDLENLTIRHDFSFGAGCLDILAQVIEAGHISSLVNLDLRSLRHEVPPSGVGVGALTPSQSLSNGGRSADSFSITSSASQSLPSASSDPSQASPNAAVCWKGFGRLAAAIKNGSLPELKTIELNVSFESRNLGDEGAESLAELIETGFVGSMRELNLEDNSIGKDGIGALGKALRCGNLSDLTVLNLSRNSFDFQSEDSDSGIMDLMIALEENHLPSLKRIGLSGAGHQSMPTAVTATYGRSVAEAIVVVYTRNTALTATIDIDWPERAAEARWNFVLQRNLKLTQLLKTLNANGAEAPVTNGKIFICGFPGVGKTTLRKSLKRSRMTAFFTNELKCHQELPTRGIEVSQITGRKKNMQPTLRLVLWDLAGQEDFHVLHSSFLPDLGLANGKATTFVAVFKANYNRSSGPSAEEELTFWLRFIASNCIAGVKRNVIVVLNTFNGSVCHERAQWCGLLDDVHKKFEDILDIRREPIILDARIMKSVKQLKRVLFEHTGSVLQNLHWPKVCQYIQNNLRSWAKENQNFPVIHWNDFTGKMAASRLGTKSLEAAVEYLHETGDLIYFRKGSLEEGESPETRLIVLDPQWFCKRIVGQLLLPDYILSDGESRLRAAPDGTLEFREIKAHFDDLLKNSPQVNYVVGMLIRLGLCYKVGDSKVLIPALVEQDDIPESLWRSGGSSHFMGQWVMGRSLTLKDTERTALPKSLFRRLQVRLAQDPELGGKKNSEYTVGKSYLTFKNRDLVILVQCDVSDDDPRDDRIDMISRPLVARESPRERLTQRKRQVELVEVVMERLQDLCFEWCPGLKFVQNVILPWPESEGVLPMPYRNTKFSLEEIRLWVQRNGLGTNKEDSDLMCWVGDEEVREDDLLSSNEIDELQKQMANDLYEKRETIEQLLIDFPLWPERPLIEEIPLEEPSSSHREENKQREEWAITNGASTRTTDSERTRRQRKVESKRTLHHFSNNLESKIEKEGQKIRQHIASSRQQVEQRIDEVLERIDEVGDKFRKTLEMQRLALQKVQHIERLSLQQKEVVPRFMYLTDVNKSGAWLSLRSLRGAVHTKAQLHLLCEARYRDGALHQVEGQKGVEISKLNEWASKIAPWLEYSLKVAIMAAQITGGLLVPGLNLLFPDFQKKDGKGLKAILAEELLTTDTHTSTTRSASGRLSAVRLNEQAAYILKNLLGDPLTTTVLDKFGLKRVTLDTDASGCSSSSSKVAWICIPCCKKYGRRVQDL